MRSHLLRKTILLIGTGVFGIAHASTIYNESVSGDLSNSGLTPTVLGISPGFNDVFGTTGKPGSVVDRDYFSFTIASGQQLSAITVLPGTSPLGPLGFSFIGVHSGSQVTVPTNTTTAAGLLGWSHYSAGDVGTDILPSIGTAGLGSTGFSGPLPSGTYSFWVQDFNVGTVPYGFEFAVTPQAVAVTPEPSTWTLTLTGIALLAGTSRRRATQLLTRLRSTPSA